MSWSGPDERVSETCSYCEAAIPDDDIPLMLWNADGPGDSNESPACARFCNACQERYWGFRFDDVPVDDDDG